MTNFILLIEHFSLNNFLNYLKGSEKRSETTKIENQESKEFEPKEKKDPKEEKVTKTQKREAFLYLFENINNNDPLLEQFIDKLKSFNIGCEIKTEMEGRKMIFLNRVEERMDAEENRKRLKNIQDAKSSNKIEDWKWFNFSKKKDIESCIQCAEVWDSSTSMMKISILDKENSQIWVKIKEWIFK